jgi:endonuclease YncB( thermonuclease family)
MSPASPIDITEHFFKLTRKSATGNQSLTDEFQNDLRHSSEATKLTQARPKELSGTGFWGCIAVVVMALTSPAHAQTLTGPARVVDGDTIVTGAERIRLSGIDAPELDQVCLDAVAGRNPRTAGRQIEGHYDAEEELLKALKEWDDADQRRRERINPQQEKPA